MANRIKVPGQLQTRAAFEPATFDDATGTVELTFTTGARGLRRSWDIGPYYEELEVSDKAVDLSRLNNRASVLDTHGQYQLSDVIGVVERAWIQNGEGRAKVRFSQRDDVKPIREDVKAGIISHVSVGYSVQKYEQVEKNAEGIPVMRATRWQPAEISLVPVAFDDQAVVRSKRDENEFYEVEVDTRGEPPHEESRMLTEEQKRAAEDQARKAEEARLAGIAEEKRKAEETTALEAKRQAENKEIAERAVAAERERATTIQGAVRIAKLGDEFAAKLVKDGAPVDKARELIFAEMAKRSDAAGISNHHAVIEAGEDDFDKKKRAIVGCLITRSGKADIVQRAAAQKAFGEDVKVDLDPGHFRGMTLLELARYCLERKSIDTRGWDRMRIASVALGMEQRGGMASASDFPVLFEEALHKVLLAAYAITSDTWSRFCKTDTVPDFRDSNRYRMGSLGVLDVVNEQGEFPNAAIPDAQKVAINVQTKGRIIAITRKALVNDDLGALSNLAAALGRASALTIEKDVYALLGQNGGLGPIQADGQPFFHANRANVNPVGAALTATALDADRVIMKKQVDQSNNEKLDISPAVLLVPAELGAQAKLLNTSINDPDALNKIAKPNIAAGMFKDVVDSARLSDISATRRYLFADPGEAPAIVVAFLEGSGVGPYLEQQIGFRTDGIEWKARMDFKAQMFDPKGAVTNPGA
jgi:hypothetical protein